MKKNFFKKLSFVMALAMLISVIAPAAGAFAATAPTLNSAKQYLFLGGISGKSEFDFNVKNRQTGWKYTWSSTNTSVATVDSKGVTTAEGIGSTKVSVKIKTSTGKAVKTLTADVIVKDNIETVAISNAPTADLAVNTAYDFNRTFTTESGSSTKTTSITKWTVDKDTATIASNGVFTATAAGEYTVTATAFQSSAKYAEYVATKNENLVLATATAKVTVAASVVSTKQVDSDTFTVTFDSDMSKTDIKTASVLYQVINDKQTSTGTEKIKSITLDTATGTVATVDTYAAFTAGNKYNFVFGKLTGSFTAAKKATANIAGITFSDFNVDIAKNPKDMLASVVAYNSDGVVIYTGSEISSYLTFTYGGDLTKGNTSGANAYIYAEGTTATITAKFSATVYDDVAKAYKTLTFEDAAVATGVKTDTAITASSLQFAAPLNSATTANADLTYSASSVTVAAKDSNKIVVKYTTNDALTTTKYDSTGATFTFKSTDADKLLVSGNNIYPITTGTVTVLVYSGTTAVGAFDVVIVAARSFATANANASALNIGNAGHLVDSVGSSATVTIQDSLGANVTATSAIVTEVAAPTGVTKKPTVSTDITTAGKVVVTAVGYNTSNNVLAEVGVYSYKVTITALGTTKDVVFTINVIDATTAAAAKVSYYQLVLDKTAVDVKGVSSSAISVSVFGYNAAGAKVTKLTAGTDYKIAVKDAKNVEPTLTYTNTSIPVVTVSGTAVVANAVGNYVVTATAVSGSSVKIGDTTVAADAYLTATTIAVSDSTTKSVAVDNYAVAAADAANVKALVQKALTLTLNGTAVSDANEANITKIEYSKGATALVADAGATTLVAGDSVYVSAVYYTVSAGGNFEYKFDVAKTITVK